MILNLRNMRLLRSPRHVPKYVKYCAKDLCPWRKRHVTANFWTISTARCTVLVTIRISIDVELVLLYLRNTKNALNNSFPSRIELYY